MSQTDPETAPHILLVEDEAPIVKFLTSTFAGIPHTLHIAHSSEQAVTLLNQTGPAAFSDAPGHRLLLTDFSLKGSEQNGVDVAQLARTIESVRKPTEVDEERGDIHEAIIILLSGGRYSPDAIKPLLHGGTSQPPILDGFLAKPLIPWDSPQILLQLLTSPPTDSDDSRLKKVLQAVRDSLERNIFVEQNEDWRVNLVIGALSNRLLRTASL